MAILCPSDASAPGHKSRTDITFLLYNDYLRYVRPCCVRLTPRTDKRSMKSLMSECPTNSPYGGNVFPDIPQKMLPKDHTFPYFDYPNSSAVLSCACRSYRRKTVVSFSRFPNRGISPSLFSQLKVFMVTGA